jgi:hypothetical protein
VPRWKDLDSKAVLNIKRFSDPVLHPDLILSSGPGFQYPEQEPTALTRPSG